MSEDIEKLRAAGKVTEEQAELLERLTPGCYCFHEGFGPGKVASWDVLGQKVVIDFEKKPGHAMGLRIVARTLKPLAADDVLAQYLDNPEATRELAEDDPVAFVGNIIRSAGGEISFVEFEDLLKGRVIAEAEYKKWWDRTKKALKGHREFVIPSRRTLPLQLRETDLTPAEQFVEDFDLARDLKEKAKLLDTMRKNLEAFGNPAEELGPVLVNAGEIAIKSQRLHPAGAIELMLARDALAKAAATETSAGGHTLAELLRVELEHLSEGVRGLSAASARQVAATLPEAFGDGWRGLLLQLLEDAGPRAFGVLAERMREDEQGAPMLRQWIERGLSQRTLGPDALGWICRNRRDLTADHFEFEVGLALLDAIDRGFSGTTRGNKALEVLESDKELVSDLLDGVGEGKVRTFCKRLMATPAIDDLTRRSLLARAIRTHPLVQDMVSGAEDQRAEEADDEMVFVSQQSLDRKRAELEDIVQRKIPENTRQIAIAREYGDLRENFEFKSAKQNQAILMRRKTELEQEIASAKVVDFRNVDSEVVSRGSVVRLGFEDGQEEEVTILGAWDSDPGRHILSYLSDKARPLMGRRVGDAVDLPDDSGAGVRVARILSLRRWPDAGGAPPNNPPALA